MRDIASGTVLVAIAVVYSLGARGLPSGPSFFPFLLAGVLFLLGASIVVSGRREREPPSGELRPWPVRMVAATILYALIFAWVGFLVSTLLYTSALVVFLGRRGIGVIAIPVVTTAILYGAFAWGLGVPLP